jgi:hypothetical protein
MSADLIVYLPYSSMPSPRGWAEAIDRAGFPLSLDTDFDVNRATGFRPCRFRGKPSGFEYYSAPLTDEDRQVFGLPAGFDFSVNLLAHADGNEWESAVVAAGVLCWLGQGVLHDPQAGAQFSAAEVLSWAHRELARAESEGRDRA